MEQYCKVLLFLQINILKYIHIETAILNCSHILQYYCIFWFKNASLMSIS